MRYHALRVCLKAACMRVVVLVFAGCGQVTHRFLRSSEIAQHTSALVVRTDGRTDGRVSRWFTLTARGNQPECRLFSQNWYDYRSAITAAASFQCLTIAVTSQGPADITSTSHHHLPTPVNGYDGSIKQQIRKRKKIEITLVRSKRNVICGCRF